MAHPKEFHSAKPKHGHEHMYEILDGHHKKSVKHEGEAVKGPGGLAVPHTSAGKEDTRAEVFKRGGRAHHKK
jgi:hypothetical protein